MKLTNEQRESLDDLIFNAGEWEGISFDPESELLKDDKGYYITKAKVEQGCPYGYVEGVYRITDTDAEELKEILEIE